MKKTHIGFLIITTENQNDFKELTKVFGPVYVRENTTFTAPKLTEVSNYIDVKENATFTAPKLKKSGSVDVRENATFIAPNLKKSGYVYVRENATFISKHLKLKNKIAKINNKEFKVIFNNNRMFIVESEKTLKEIKIYSGILKIKLESNKVVVWERGFVAEKGGFSAHGSTVKSSVFDLQFKIDKN